MLTQTDMMVALRTTAPHDQRAIGEWIKAKGVEEQREERLPSLPTGTGSVWAPELNILRKAHLRLVQAT